MGKLSSFDWVALVLVLIGALNWGLVGLFGLDLVAVILGKMTIFSRIIYVVVGIAAVYVAVISGSLAKKKSDA
jgi:uncharacterized membrane protein YuzA (DUF378 family)